MLSRSVIAAAFPLLEMRLRTLAANQSSLEAAEFRGGGATDTAPVSTPEIGAPGGAVRQEAAGSPSVVNQMEGESYGQTSYMHHITQHD
jgi:hypothetical protein